MSVLPIARVDLVRTELALLPVAPALKPQRILTVRFRSPDGRTWNAIGGGDTLAAAIAWARESCPHGTKWEPVGWEHLYGE